MADGREILFCFLRMNMSNITLHPSVNQARALRIAEIMTDFRNIQHYIASIRAAPSAEEYNSEGYQILRQCIVDAQAVMAQPFSSSAVHPRGNPEQEKSQLRQ